MVRWRVIGKQRILHDRKYFYRVHSQTLQVVQFLHGARETMLNVPI